jgi:hypothetical protein
MKKIKSAMTHQSWPIWQCYDRVGVPQYIDRIGYTFHATILGKCGFHTFQPEIPQKSLPITSPGFLHQALVNIGLSEQGGFFLIWRKMGAIKENGNKKTGGRNKTFNHFIHY